MTTSVEPTGPAHASLRIGDAERERAATALSEHFAAGRLSLAEFTERSDAAVVARTSFDLARLTADLPRLDAPGRPAGPPVVLVRRVGGPAVVADVFFAIFGPLAAVCLLLLLGMTGGSSAFTVGFFAAFGGAVSFGALVHLLHRQAVRRDQASTGWAE